MLREQCTKRVAGGKIQTSADLRSVFNATNRQEADRLLAQMVSKYAPVWLPWDFRCDDIRSKDRWGWTPWHTQSVTADEYKHGLDVAHGYSPSYEVMPAKKETVGDLKRAAARAK